MANETVVHVIDDDAAVRDSIAFLLETADLIRLIEVPPGSKGGAPKRLYSVNPAVHEVAA